MVKFWAFFFFLTCTCWMCSGAFGEFDCFIISVRLKDLFVHLWSFMLMQVVFILFSRLNYCLCTDFEECMLYTHFSTQVVNSVLYWSSQMSFLILSHMHRPVLQNRIGFHICIVYIIALGCRLTKKWLETEKLMYNVF